MAHSTITWQMSAARRPLRAAVIGVGRMGANHARVASELPDVELTAVADLDGDAAREVARRHGVTAYASPDDLLAHERPEVVVVAVPTEHHVAVAAAALRAGAHVLVEKPIASEPAAARRLLRIAAAEGCRLVVGHVERFNPAVQELARRIRRGEAGRIFEIHTQRFSPPVRVRDAGVLLDLGTHDLDIMRFLTSAEPERVSAVMRRHAHPRHEDLVVATLLFPDGIIGLLEVNWLSPVKVRHLAVLGARGMFTVDYLAQELVFHESVFVAGGWEARDLLSGGGEGRIERIPIAHVEPLRAEWEAFVRTARGRAAPVVTGEDALRTIEVAAAIARAAARGTTVTLRGDRAR